MIERALLVAAVREALRRYHDAGYLTDSPLASVVPLEVMSEATAASGVRRLLREAISTLAQSKTVPTETCESLSYRVLWMRYVQRQSVVQVCNTLNISRATFYRYHEPALLAVADTIRVRYAATKHGDRPQIADARLEHATEATDQARRLAQETPRVPVDIGQVLRQVRETATPLLGQHAIGLMPSISEELPVISADPGLLRLLFMNLLTESVRQAASPVVQLSVQPVSGELLVRLGPLKPVSSFESTAGSPALAVSRALIEAYGGRLWLDQGMNGRSTLAFALPIQTARAILVIEDDADAMRLYQVCLSDSGFTVCTARNQNQLNQQLSAYKPSLILLDVLMPGWDGWSILRDLRKSADTTHIPVIVCSVLSQPDLALTLGAAAVLQKPFDQQTLLRTIRLALKDSGG